MLSNSLFSQWKCFKKYVKRKCSYSIILVPTVKLLHFLFIFKLALFVVATMMVFVSSKTASLIYPVAFYCNFSRYLLVIIDKI